MVAKGRRLFMAKQLGWAAVVAVGLLGCTQSVTPAAPRPSGLVTVTFRTAAPATEADLAKAAQVLRQRLATAGIVGAQVAAAADTLHVAVPAGHERDIRDLVVAGHLRFRTVIGSMPATSTHASVTVAPPQVQPPLEALTCAAAPRPEPQDVLLACDRSRATKYALEAAFLSNDSISKVTARPPDAQNPSWSILLEMTDRGEGIWAQYTSTHVQQQVAMEVDGVVLSAPTIQTPITGGETQITGSFDEHEARTLEAVLSFEPLPVTLT